MERVCTHRQEGTLWAGTGEWAPAPDFSRTPPAPLQSPGSSLALSLAALRSPGTVGLSQRHRLPLPLGCPVFCLAALGWGVEGTLNRLGAGGRGPLPHSTGVPSPCVPSPSSLSAARPLPMCCVSALSRRPKVLRVDSQTCGPGRREQGWGWSPCWGARERAAPSHPAQGAQLGADPERPDVSVSDEAGNPGFYEKSNF